MGSYSRSSTKSLATRKICNVRLAVYDVSREPLEIDMKQILTLDIQHITFLSYLFCRPSFLAFTLSLLVLSSVRHKPTFPLPPKPSVSSSYLFTTLILFFHLSTTSCISNRSIIFVERYSLRPNWATSSNKT